MKSPLFCFQLLFLAVCLAFAAGCRQGGEAHALAALAPAVKYTLYIGTNHKNTLEPVMPSEQARAVVTDIALRHTAGFTLIDGQGTWVDRERRVTREHTLVCTFLDINEKELRIMLDEILAALHQSSILVERADASIRLYGEP